MGTTSILTVTLAVLAVLNSEVSADPHFNSGYYPGVVQGFNSNNYLYGYQPQIGYQGCGKFWCKSRYNGKYYCCTSVGSGGFFNGGLGHRRPGFNGLGFGGNRLVGNGFRRGNVYRGGLGYRPHRRY